LPDAFDARTSLCGDVLISAQNGAGNVAPNPMVGCVIVHEGHIIGEGFHQQFGGPHAEVNAISNVAIEKKQLLSSSTLYVNLEPCSHHGKTPPCSDLIIHHKIPSIIVGCTDPNPQVSGRGIEKLKHAGCHVEVGVLVKESRHVNRRFITWMEQKRPYLILNGHRRLMGSSPLLIARGIRSAMSIRKCLLINGEAKKLPSW
jgi:diaminohydroxyphosphoribosylaminopyrimidine deaminase/5-amino-6-(5-phosphoribosylamino)uracil reductase